MSAPITAITMPQWGLTMTEGKVVNWLKPEGAAFSEGDEILEIETSKITNVVEADAAGVLRRVVAQAGATLPVGALLGVVAPETMPEAVIDEFVAGFKRNEPAAAAAVEAPAPRELEAAGTRLRFLELGSGGDVPILFLHGFGADLNSWMFNQPDLAEERRTVALDLPGHGGSAKDLARADADALVDVVEGALSELGIGRVHLAGHSLGGAVATALAVRRPERIASLTLIAPAGLGPEINQVFIDGFVRMARRKDAQEVLALLVHDPAMLSRAMVEDVLRYKRIDGVSAALERFAQAWFAGGRQLLDLRAGLAALPMPVQVIWGRDDGIIPVAHAEALGPRVAVHILPGAGHLPHMEKAREVNRLIRRFIGS